MARPEYNIPILDGDHLFNSAVGFPIAFTVRPYTSRTIQLLETQNNQAPLDCPQGGRSPLKAVLSIFSMASMASSIRSMCTKA